MGYRGWAKKRDSNEPEIIAGLERMGYLVIPMDKPLDLLCAKRGTWLWVEVKSKPTENLTEDQRRFFASARHMRAPCYRVDTVDDVMLMDAELFK